MEIYFLNRDFEVIFGPITDMAGYSFEESFSSAGEFSVLLSGEYYSSACEAVYVRTGAEGGFSAGRIDSVYTDGCECRIEGRSLEVLLNDRVMVGEGIISGYGYDVVLEAVKENLRGLPIVLDEESAAVFAGYAAVSYSWGALGSWLYGVLVPRGMSYKVALVGDSSGGLYPEMKFVKGTDRTQGDGAVVFSPSFGNIRSLEESVDGGKMKNYAYVEGGDGYAVEVDGRLSSADEKREVRILARELTAEKFALPEHYTSALVDYGRAALNRTAAVSTVTADASPARYAADYRLGDTVSVQSPQTVYTMRLEAIIKDESKTRIKLRAI